MNGNCGKTREPQENIHVLSSHTPTCHSMPSSRRFQKKLSKIRSVKLCDYSTTEESSSSEDENLANNLVSSDSLLKRGEEVLTNEHVIDKAAYSSPEACLNSFNSESVSTKRKLTEEHKDSKRVKTSTNKYVGKTIYSTPEPCLSSSTSEATSVKRKHADEYEDNCKRVKGSTDIGKTIYSTLEPCLSSSTSEVTSSKQKHADEYEDNCKRVKASTNVGKTIYSTPEPCLSSSTSEATSSKRKHEYEDNCKRVTTSPALETQSVDLNFNSWLSENKQLPECFQDSTPKQPSWSFQNYVKSDGDQTPYSPLLRTPIRYRQKFGSFLPSYNHNELQKSFDVGFIDSHCHLDFLFKRAQHNGSFEAYRKMLKDYFPVSYQGCVANFCDPATFKKQSLWKPLIEENGVWAAFGCHPHNAAAYNNEIEDALLEALCCKKVIALGEIGLDYSNRNNCNKLVQHKVFIRQLHIALGMKLPLVIHSRESDEDCFKIMKKIVPDNYHIHLHCFTGAWDLAKMWLDGFPNLKIGITNVVTFPSATSVHNVVKNIPLNRLLLETDTPYFLPRTLPRSLKWSHPGMAIHVAAQICAIRESVTLDELLRIVRENTRYVYGI